MIGPLGGPIKYPRFIADSAPKQIYRDLWLEMRDMFRQRRQNGLHQTESVQAVFIADRTLRVTRGGPLVRYIPVACGHPRVVFSRRVIGGVS
jgi:hypothetical protein